MVVLLLTTLELLRGGLDKLLISLICKWVYVKVLNIKQMLHTMFQFFLAVQEINIHYIVTTLVSAFGGLLYYVKYIHDKQIKYLESQIESKDADMKEVQNELLKIFKYLNLPKQD